MSETDMAQSNTSLCSFCVEIGWANLSLDQEKHDKTGIDQSEWNRKYKITAQQLQDSVEASCWWCENLGNAVLERDEWTLNQDAIVASYDVDMYLLGSQGRQTRLLGPLLVDIYGRQNDDEVVFERRLKCGVFAKWVRTNASSQQHVH